MLHTQTVQRKTFELLTKLMQDPMLQGFNLAGGTALALYMGHRISIDLDLFTPDEFDTERLDAYLTEHYGLHTTFKRNFTLKGIIDGVAIDCIRYAYPYLAPVTVENGIRLYSKQDIAAMKLSAIADNGTRLKDFIDIAYLSTLMSLEEMLTAYDTKFPNSTRLRAIKGLGYYEDIDFNEPIMLLEGNFEWKAIAQRLTDMAKHDTELFDMPPVRKIGIPSVSPKKKTSKPKI